MAQFRDQPPDSTSTADQLDAYVRTRRGALLASLLLYSVAMGLFLCFVLGTSIGLLIAPARNVQ